MFRCTRWRAANRNPRKCAGTKLVAHRFRCTRWRAANRNMTPVPVIVAVFCSAVLAGEQRIETSSRDPHSQCPEFRCTRWRAANRNSHHLYLNMNSAGPMFRCTRWRAANRNPILITNQARLDTVFRCTRWRAANRNSSQRDHERHVPRSAVLAGEQRIETT